MSRTAVVLFNLGGPDSKEAIEPFLFNFFTDANIIRLPWIFRRPLAKFISKKRANREAGASYAALGYKSPLLENTRAQAAALEERLGNGFRVFVCMRYWHPMAKEVIAELEHYKPEKLILLTLYPQFSTTTVKSSIENFWTSVQESDGWLHRQWDDVKPAVICCYPFSEGFIQGSAEAIKASYAEAVKDGHPNPRLLFSAHGLPESVIRDGDPYQWQCEETAKRIAGALGIEGLDWAICYQSRVGPMKWIGPSIEQELRRAASDGKVVIVYPHAFTQEHVETLVELDIEYRHLADEIGVPAYYRVQTVSTHPLFVGGLAKLVLERVDNQDVCAEGGNRLCPKGFKSCPCGLKN
jgi:protoporphyrin/coproporphyrin ferrochelatase